ncbi:hypothetical protein BV22DRAFT_172398 [Leucogyrophana mollusca]|uniref:Uncharacterized protein n=1 Tax=Leucogyrophana mollusca TaxID=85980 RepID=A0ACB8BVH9_9AGAM|nr:hypothetical protein BV22DRAFT_172398 [Leucogyrophana mollusca]
MDLLRFLGSSKESLSSTADAKGKQREHSQPELPDGGNLQVLVQTNVQSSSSAQPTSTPPASSHATKPPGLRVLNHPYPYWQHHGSSTSSQSSLESPVTPSNVAWLSGDTPGSAGASSSSLPLAHALGRSASTSSSTPTLLPCHFPPPPTTAPPTAATSSPSPVPPRPKLLHPSKSAHSLRVPIQEFFAQQLSPIVEQDYLSPEKRPVSLPCSSNAGTSPTRTSGSAYMMTPISPATITPTSAVPMSPIMVTARTTPTTPISPAQGIQGQWARARQESLSDSPRPSPVYSTFLSRPLNRSISMSSTRTHHSGASATPPVIPPLDLRPEFPGPFQLPRPLSATSRDTEDDTSSARAESFTTAPAARDSRYSAQGPEHEAEPERNAKLDELPRIPEPAHWHGAQRPLAPSRSSSYPPSYTHPHAHEFQPNKSFVSAPSLRSFPSASSSFIDRRFASSELYLSSRTDTTCAREAGKKWSLRRGKADTACIMFWVGFIAPWCWLIGGWLVNANQNGNVGRGGSLLPLYTGKGVQSREALRSHPYSGYPFIAPSAASLAPPSYHRSVLQPKTLRLKVASSPWIRRCRLAAGAGGVVVVIAFVVALLVVSRS